MLAPQAFGNFEQSNKDTKVGWTAGGGAEFLHDTHWLLRAEALFVDLGSETHSYSITGQLWPCKRDFEMGRSVLGRAGRPRIQVRRPRMLCGPAEVAFAVFSRRTNEAVSFVRLFISCLCRSALADALRLRDRAYRIREGVSGVKPTAAS